MVHNSLSLASLPLCPCLPASPPARWRMARVLGALLLGMIVMPAGIAHSTTPNAAVTPPAAGSPSQPGPVASDEIIHVVRPGETLLGLSHALLDTPQRWRDVQRLNDIQRPRRLQPGTRLRIRQAWLKPEAVAATIRSTSNKVAIDGKPAQDGHTIKEGSTIRTGPDSTAVIVLPDGTTLRIPSATEVRLERLRAYHGEKDLDAGFLLQRGGIEPDSPGKRSRPLNIRTPAGNALVRGTHFRVQAQAKHSVVEVLRGQVAAGNRRGTADVDAGKGARFTPTSKPVVEKLPAAPDLGSLDGHVMQQVSNRIALPPMARGMTAYQVAVSTRPDFSDVLMDTQVHEPWFQLKTRQDGPHYLRVRQVSRQSIAGYDAVARIEVAARPLPPRLQAQPGTVMAGRPVTFRWKDADGTPTGSASHRYRLQVASDPRFEQILHDVIVPASQTGLYLGTPSPLERWWRVAAISGSKQGPFSAAGRFTLQVPAPISTSKPRAAVKSSDGEPIRTGSGDFLLLGR